MADNPVGDSVGGVAQLEVAARLDQRPGNPALTPDGRLILSLHPYPYGEPSPYRVVEVMEDNSTRPFPNEDWSTAPDEDGVGISATIGVQSDRRGVVWILDIGSGEHPPKLVAWDTRRDELHRVITLPPHARHSNSFQQDLAIDEVRGAIFIADSGRGDLFGPSDPAIVVVDLKTGQVRRALQGHPSLQFEEDVSLVVEGKPVQVENPNSGELQEPKLGLDPIVIDPANEWLYYAPAIGTSVYRIRASDLLDERISPDALGERVERYEEKPACDGISIDVAGNVYITDLSGNAIGLTKPDGFFYVTVSQLHRSAVLNAGEEVSKTPFLVLRFRPLAPSVVGR